jgi:plastocyanin
MTQTRLVTLGLATLGLLAASVPVGGAVASPAVKTVRVEDDQYTPAKVTIKRGSEVKWVWSSGNYGAHNVTLLKAPKGVKKSKYSSVTRTRSFKFKRVLKTSGKYLFVCTVHPGMNMTVVVKH